MDSGPRGAERGAAATDTARGAGGSDALPDVLRRALHARLPDAHRYTEIHQENLYGKFARIGANDTGVKPAGRDLRACVPGAGIVRRRVRAGIGAQADRHRTSAT